MLVKYEGPSESVHVPPYPDHPRGEIRDYPDEFGRDLVENSRRQVFSFAEDGTDDGVLAIVPGNLDELDIDRLRDLCSRLGIKYGPRANEPTLIKLIRKNTAEPPVETE